MNGFTQKRSLAAQPDPEQDQIGALLARVRRGDDVALPELRAALDGAPGLWEAAGDVAMAARRAWADLVAGGDPLTRDAVLHKAAAVEAGAAGPDPSPLVSLLAARVAACWLQVHHAEAVAAKHLPLRLATFALQRVDVANRRLLRAISVLAEVRRHLPEGALSRPAGGSEASALKVVAPPRTRERPQKSVPRTKGSPR